MKNRRATLLFIAAGVFTLPVVLFAQGFEEIGTQTGLSTDFIGILGTIIRVIISLLGLVMLGLMIYSGITWMTAGGDDGKVLKAKETMIRAVIGFALVLMSFAITTFIMNWLGSAGLWFGGGGDQNGPGVPPFSNSLGNGGITDHYPGRDQIGVPKNTRILVTFKGVVHPNNFIVGFDDGGTPSDFTDDTVPPGAPLNTDMISIYKTVEGVGEKFASEQVEVGYSIINTDTIKTSTFVFIVPLLDGLTNYSVLIDQSLEDIEGASLINCNGSDMTPRECEGYRWEFKTSDILDLTPPQVQSVVPIEGRTYGRNVAIQITFDEAMDPASVSGLLDAAKGGVFSNIKITRGTDTDGVEGVFSVSNGYRTVTYLTNDACGTNSCGQTIYCLPASSTINAYIESPAPADAAQSPQVPATPYPPAGATDVVGNALDGSGNGEIEVNNDDYAWDFLTDNRIVLDGPAIETIEPAILQGQVALDMPVSIVFNDILLASSVLPGVSVLFQPNPSHEMWFVTRINREDGAVKDTVALPHGVFQTSTKDVRYNYNVQALEKVQNLYQNCFIPAEGPGSDGRVCEPTAAEPYCCNGELSATSCLPRS